MHASPRRRQNVWIGKTEAVGTVVAMDASYFDRKAVVKMLRSACGCVREGVGCAVCGNTLGTRYKPCQAAAEGLFNGSPRTLRELRPEGSRYWHAHPTSRPKSPTASASTSPPYYIYTFFSSNVSSSPDFTFPHHPPTPRSAPTMIGSAAPAYDSAVFDRGMTQSPMPIWEDSGVEGAEMELDPEPEADPWEERPFVSIPDNDARTAREPPQELEPASGRGVGAYNYGSISSIMFPYQEDRVGLRAGDELLDPDGVVIDTGSALTEPSTPDKGEGMLLPER